MILTILWSFAIWFALSVYFLFRNHWVHNQRSALICGQKPGMDCWFTNPDTFLLSYNAMIVRFWVWNVGKLTTDHDLYLKVKFEIQ